MLNYFSHIRLLLTVPFLLLPLAPLTYSTPAYAGGSVQQHLTLDIMPLTITPQSKSAGAFALSYDRYHDKLKSSYALSFEQHLSYRRSAESGDADSTLLTVGFFTQITPAFSLGARLGTSLSSPDGRSHGIAALALRLPALYPDEKDFFSFFFEEIDLGLSGAGERYATFRLGMLLL